MQITKDLVIQLRQIKEEKGLSLSNILDMIEQNNEFVSKTTLSRIFSDDSETQSFKPETLLPIARVLLDTDNEEETDTLDEKALKALLKYKGSRIQELEQQIEQLEMELNKEKLKRHEILDKERDIYNRRVDFLKSQILLKDERIDKLMNALFEKNNAYESLLSQVLSCPYSHIGDKK
jgi:transcriptional regulator with XRE-family HTH domain